MKKVLASLLLVCGLAIGISAQTAAYTSTPIAVGQVGGGVGSGTTFYFYAVPMTIGGASGTAVVYPQGQGGFILFRPPLEGSDYVTANVTSATINSRDSIGRTTSLTVTYTVNTDPNLDGDMDVVMGTITFNIAYVPAWHGPRPVITGGSGAQSITTD